MTGLTCDTPSSECNGVRCVYGSCVRDHPGGDSYTCRCSPGYTGKSQVLLRILEQHESKFDFDDIVDDMRFSITAKFILIFAIDITLTRATVHEKSDII